MQRVVPDSTKFDPEFDAEMAECPWRTGGFEYGWDAPKRIDKPEPQSIVRKETPR